MVAKIEVYYTGGGITIAEADVDSETYAVVSSEAPDFMTIYKFDEGDRNHLPEHMVLCSAKDKITKDLQRLYKEMRKKLKAA